MKRLKRCTKPFRYQTSVRVKKCETTTEWEYTTTEQSVHTTQHFYCYSRPNQAASSLKACDTSGGWVLLVTIATSSASNSLDSRIAKRRHHRLLLFEAESSFVLDLLLLFRCPFQTLPGQKKHANFIENAPTPVHEETQFPLCLG